MLLAIGDVLIGGQLLLFLPKSILRILSKIPFLCGYTFHLQPTVLDRHLVHDEDKLLKISIKVLDELENGSKVSQKYYAGKLYMFS